MVLGFTNLLICNFKFFYLLTSFASCTLRYNDIKFEYEITNDSLSWLSSVANRLHGHAGYYDSRRMIATRAEFWKDSVFLVTPKLYGNANNNPFTVSRLHLHLRGHHPPTASVLLPFPSWMANEPDNKDGIGNAVDIFIDEKDIMWILDCGTVNDRDGNNNQSLTKFSGRRPKFLSYDIKRGKILKTISLSNLTCSRSKVKNIFAEYTADNRCFVYVTDCAANGAIIVWDMSLGKGYRSILPAAVKGFYQEPDDVLYTALANRTTGSAVIYFSHLRSDLFFAIETRHLRQKTENDVIRVISKKLHNYVLLGSNKQLLYLYLRKLNPADDRLIYRWNVERESLESELSQVVYESDPSYVCNQIITDSNGQLWAVETDRHQHYLLEVNNNNSSSSSSSSSSSNNSSYVIAKLIKL